MEKIRVLIVDDSAIIRRLLSNALTADPAIEVVGMAANGKIAMSKILELKPDLITLDIEMPEMDGLETLVEIRKLYPKLPVIMFSTLTERGAIATLDALARGANDYVTKPSNTGSVEVSTKRVQDELIPKIRVFCRRAETAASNIRSTSPAVAKHAELGVLSTMSGSTGSHSTANRSSPPNRIDAIVIGTSTGGPNALTKLLPELPANFDLPILIVQHMPPIFTTRLAERLNQLSTIPVVEATHRMKVEPGKAYLAPGDFHMLLVRAGSETHIVLNQDPPECSCRPAVDALFRSAGSLYGSSLLAVVLTGMGQDGLAGCGLIRAAGGQVLAQDEATSVVWGMPGAVTKAGLAQEVLPLEAMAKTIEWKARCGRRGASAHLVGATSS